MRWFVLLQLFINLCDLKMITHLYQRVKKQQNSILTNKSMHPNDIMKEFHFSSLPFLDISHQFNFSNILNELSKDPEILKKFNNFTEITFRNSNNTSIELKMNLSQIIEAKINYCNFSSKFRTIDGSCNNIKNPFLGKTNECFHRLLPPKYADDISSFRKMKSGQDLPNPYLISRILTGGEFHSKIGTSLAHNGLFVSWGQFLAHDLTLTPTFRQVNNIKGGCCSDPKYPECEPLTVNFDDAYFDQNQCFSYIRSFGFLKRKSTYSLEFQREQLNKLTAYIDASNVYGTTAEEIKFLRDENEGATLKSEKIPYEIPVRSNKWCKTSFKNCENWCLLLGEDRASVTSGLMGIHTLWLREHNRLVKKFRLKYWDEEKLFQEVRKIVGALMQHIAFSEYLPLLLGQKVMTEMKLSVPTVNYTYDPSICPNILNSFAGAAFRFGHSMVSRNIQKKNSKMRLVTDFFSVDDFCNSSIDPVDSILIGRMKQRAELVDHIFSKEITHFLFANSTHSRGLDLLALDILRGRDHGLPGYNDWRRRCHLRPVKTDEDMKLYIRNNAIQKLKILYENNMDDMDLYIGGISEIPTAGSIIGPTFGCIIAEQFRRLKFGDRFWYENLKKSSSFSEEQIREIRKTTVASLICRNTDLGRIQPKAFLVLGINNWKKECTDIVRDTDINPTFW